MKKIMFNDRYGLTQAVLDGRKTMTRRIVPDGTPLGNWEETVKKSRYKVGEVVAVAESYEAIRNERYKDYCNDIYNPFGAKGPDLESEPGWTNKMFVRAELMPYRIKITNIKVERLQDISNEDCLKEGIKEKSRFPHKKSYPFYFDGGKHGWDNSYRTPRQAFASLIDKVCGRGTWNTNPYVFVYEFELLKGGDK
jgi:hypothetical protein